MPLPRPFALIQTEDQWLRASHENTALEAGVVQLAFEDEPAVMPAGGSTAPGAGLAFDGHCRLYHSLPPEGRVTRQHWPHRQSMAPLDLFAAPTDGPVGAFRPAPGPVPALREPRGLVVDDNARLFIAEAGARRILVFDLGSERLLRKIPVAGHPLDLALLGRSVVAVLTAPTGLLQLDARSGPRPLPLPAAGVEPARVAVCPQGKVFVLDRAGTDQARVLVDGRPPIDVAWATDIELLPGPVLVAARLPGQDFLRLRLGGESIEGMPPLKARDYDGLGIVRTPDDRIGFFTAHGFRHAVPARVRYVPKGRVTSFRLDSGEFRTQWGRLFLDACIPQDTTVQVHCVATDDPPEDEDALPRKLPANVREALIARPDLSPPMPPESLAPQVIEQALHRRETGRELPFAPRSANDPFETYEAPIMAGPGRFLWVALELSGNTRFTPRVRALRAEYPTHDYLRRLPQVFSRDERGASFLRRYLAMFDGFFGELEVRATARQALLDPQGAPSEILPWLAGFLGLVLDERWPVATQRAIIQEAAWLFRFRGTVPGLTRFLELYTGTKVILIEQFRLRGLGTVGESGGPQARAILGGGFRVGGALGAATAEPLSGSAADAFHTHAHRFSVMIPAELSADQLDVVRQILEVHRPAHTMVEVCTVDAGMRVGRGLHLGLTSVIGRSGGFAPLQTGAALLGRGVVLGRPGAGVTVESSRLGQDSRVG
jgi:phage tail-like protein